MNAFNVCVAIIVILTLAGFVVGLVRAKSDEERIPAVAAFTAQVVVVAVFLVLVAGMHKSGAVPVVLALACAVLPIVVYLIAQRACGGAGANAAQVGQVAGEAAARDGRSKDDVWNNLRGPGQAAQPVQPVPQQAQAGGRAQPAWTGQAQASQAGQVPTAQTVQPLRPVPVEQLSQDTQAVRPVQAANPAQSSQGVQARRGAEPAAQPVATPQTVQPAQVSQPTQPVKPVQPVQSHSGATPSSAQPAQSATPQTGKEVTQRFAPVTTASGIAGRPASAQGDAGSEERAAQPGQAAHSQGTEQTAVLEPVRPQGAAQEASAPEDASARAQQPAQAQPTAAQQGADSPQAKKVQAEEATQVQQTQQAQQPAQDASVHHDGQEQQSEQQPKETAQPQARAQSAAQPAQPAQLAQPMEETQAATAQAAQTPSHDLALPDPAEPGIDEREIARRRAAQEASRRASIAYADRKAKAEAFRSKGKYLIAAGLFEKAAETAPNKASRRTVAFEQLSCYVKAGKTDKARELAMVLRRESTLTRAERVKLNAILSQG